MGAAFSGAWWQVKRHRLSVLTCRLVRAESGCGASYVLLCTADVGLPTYGNTTASGNTAGVCPHPTSSVRTRQELIFLPRYILRSPFMSPAYMEVRMCKHQQTAFGFFTIPSFFRVIFVFAVEPPPHHVTLWLIS